MQNGNKLPSAISQYNGTLWPQGSEGQRSKAKVSLGVFHLFASLDHEQVRLHIIMCH